MKLRLNLPKARGLFITGTDTGVGKTIVAGGIAHLLGGHMRTGVFKPVASGCRKEAGRLIAADAEFLAMCSQGDWSLETITPVRYEIPAAPIVCAEYENRPVNFDAVAAAYRHIVSHSDAVIVEGIGGVMVPLNESCTILDLAAAMGLPAVVVARPDLGTLNHTLMTVACVRAAGLRVAGVVICGYNEADADIAEQTAARVISGFGQTNILCIVPREPQASVEECRLGPGILAALGECEWKDLLYMNT